MTEENISQEFRFENIEEKRNYFLEELSKINWWVKSIKRFV